jgi:hypothetical protein
LEVIAAALQTTYEDALERFSAKPPKQFVEQCGKRIFLWGKDVRISSSAVDGLPKGASVTFGVASGGPDLPCVEVAVMNFPSRKAAQKYFTLAVDSPTDEPIASSSKVAWMDETMRSGALSASLQGLLG